MASNQILSKGYRSQIIKEIESDENLKRKQESLKRYEVYNDRLEEYIYSILRKELSAETVDDMRVISSINLCKRIINEQSSIYNRKPERMIHNSDDKTEELFNNIYTLGRFNTSLKRANVAFNLQDQCALQVIPKGGRLKLKVLQPHHYDVIPNLSDPEKADVYILSQYDKENLFSQTDNRNNSSPQPSAIEYRNKDNQNQVIADEGDWQGLRGTYVWWSDEYHFSTDRNGDILNPVTMQPMLGEIDVNTLINPIGRSPFVDIKEDSDGEYWQRFGNATVDFAIQMSIILSDVTEVNRLQGFAQPIVSALEPPVDMKIGANTILFLKKSANADVGEQPSFEFASPNPDLQGSIEVVKTLLSMFLTSKGLDPAVVSAEGTNARYSSGVDRLLSNIEKFEASQDDFELFKWVEKEVFVIVKMWLDTFSGVSVGGLMDELSGIIPNDVSFDIKFDKPMAQISESDKIDLLAKKLDLGIISKLEAIMSAREVDEDKAREIMEDIDSEQPDLSSQFGGISGNREENA